MSQRTRPTQMLLRLTLAATALALSACDGGGPEEGELAGLDNQIIGNDADPALTSALQDQILVDPALTQQSNRNAVRPATTPTQAQYPVAEGAANRPAAAAAQAMAQQQGQQQGQAVQGSAPRRPAQVASGPQRQSAPSTAGDTASGSCGGNAPFNYDRSWANRLPGALPVYPGARITDAAGHDTGSCRARVVTFTTAEPAQRVLDWYRDRALRSGYSAEQQRRDGDTVLGGTNEGDGGAYYLIVTPRGNGSEVALIVNNGR